VLSRPEIDRFIETGHLRLEGAIAPDVAAGCAGAAAAQLGFGAGPPWPVPVIRGLVTGTAVAEAARSPRLIAAVGQLLAGERWQPLAGLGLFVLRCPSPVDPGDTGWHVDAGFPGPDTDSLLTWYVDARSTGRGLLLLCLLTDVGPDDAPTRILDGSHRQMPALLAPFGDAGVVGLQAPLPDPVGPVSLATGQAGDVYLCHPFLVHAAGWPHRGDRPRVLAQPPVAIDGGLRLDAPSGERSPVSTAVVSGGRGRSPGSGGRSAR